MERYISLYRLPENLYTEESPIVIAAGALLKDNQTNKVLAQLKFKNLSRKEIKALKVNIKAFDVSGAELQGVEDYQYLDLSAASNMEFGQDKAIPMPDDVTRAISVFCTSIIFSDNSMWEAKGTLWEPLPKQRNLENLLGNNGLCEQYRRDTTPLARFEPMEYQDLWLCSCGEINKKTENTCISCDISREQFFLALNTENLKQNKEQFEIQEAEAREAQAQQKAKSRVKAKKNVIILSAVILFILVVVVLINQVFIPMQKYSLAVSAMNEGKYDEAITAFEHLGDYKDSKVNRTTAQINLFIEEKDYYNAIICLVDKIILADSKGNYQADYDKILECASSIFEECSFIYKIETYDIERLIIIYTTLNSDTLQKGAHLDDSKVLLYNISEEEIGKSDPLGYGSISQSITFEKEYVEQKRTINNQKTYENANALFDNGDYEGAAAAFSKIGNYKDSEQRVKESQYKQADYYSQTKNYKAAIDAYVKLEDYEDSEERAKEETYKYAEFLVQDGEYNAAIDVFASLRTYKDAEAKTVEIKKQQIDNIHQLIGEGKSDEAWKAYNELIDYEVLPLSVDDFIITGDSADNGKMDVIADLQTYGGGESTFSYFYFDPNTDKNEFDVISTARGIHLGMTKLEVILAYGSGEEDVFSTKHKFYKDVDSPIAEQMKENCSSYLKYTPIEDWDIYFYFDANNEVSFIFFAYAYSLSSGSTGYGAR